MKDSTGLILELTDYSRAAATLRSRDRKPPRPIPPLQARRGATPHADVPDEADEPTEARFCGVKLRRGSSDDADWERRRKRRKARNGGAR